MKLPSREGKTQDEYQIEVAKIYEQLFSEPPPFAIISGFEMVETAILSGEQITEESMGYEESLDGTYA